MAQEAFYLNLGLPVYVKTTSREAFQNAVVQEGHILLFSQDGKKLIGKTSSGDYIEIGSNSFDFSAATATASDALASKTFWNSQGVLTIGNIPTVTAVLEGNKVIIPRGYISDSTSITVSGGADIQAGYIDANGNFQPLSFNGTTASDSGSAVSGLSHAIFNTGHDEPAYPQGGGGSMDFYKCTSVASTTPQVVSPQDAQGNSGTGYTISASSIYGESWDSWKAFNGQSVESNHGWFTSSSADAPHWIQILFTTAKVVNSYSFSISWDSQNQHYSAWKLQGSNDGTAWTDLDVVTGQDLSQYDPSYSSDISNSTAYTYYRIYFASTEEAYIGVQNVKLKNIPAKTWTGNKAVLNNGVYSFQSDSTSGLTYSVITPTPGKVYADGALAEVSLYVGIPTTGLVYYHRCDALSVNDECGHALTYNQGDIAIEEDSSLGKEGNKIMNLQAGTVVADLGTDYASSDWTISTWMKKSLERSSFNIIFLSGQATYYRCEMGGFYSTVDYSNTAYIPSGATITNWNHYVYIRSGSMLYLYLNGVSVGTATMSSIPDGTVKYLSLGSNDTTATGVDGTAKYGNVRMYNRVLSSSEILSLANEFTPTNA